MGGGPCVIIIGDTGNKANQIKALCDGALLDLANGDWANRTDATAFENRVTALLASVEDCFTEAQAIVTDFE